MISNDDGEHMQNIRYHFISL